MPASTICQYRLVSADLGASEPALLTIRKPSRVLTGQARDALCPRSSTCLPPRLSSRRSETGWLSEHSPLVPHPFFCVLRCARIRAKRFIRRTLSIKLREGSRFQILKTKLRIRLSKKSRSFSRHSEARPLMLRRADATKYTKATRCSLTRGHLGIGLFSPVRSPSQEWMHEGEMSRLGKWGLIVPAKTAEPSSSINRVNALASASVANILVSRARLRCLGRTPRLRSNVTYQVGVIAPSSPVLQHSSLRRFGDDYLTLVAAHESRTWRATNLRRGS